MEGYPEHPTDRDKMILYLGERDGAKTFGDAKRMYENDLAVVVAYFLRRTDKKERVSKKHGKLKVPSARRR